MDEAEKTVDDAPMMRAVIEAEEEAGNISTVLAQSLMDQVCRLRGSIGTLYDYGYQPIPVRNGTCPFPAIHSFE